MKNKILVFWRYFKMIFPLIGTFTNGAYDIFGLRWFGEIHGKVIFSKHPIVHSVGDWVIFPEYHLPTNLIPQFKLKKYENTN